MEIQLFVVLFLYKYQFVLLDAVPKEVKKSIHLYSIPRLSSLHSSCLAEQPCSAVVMDNEAKF